MFLNKIGTYSRFRPLDENEILIDHNYDKSGLTPHEYKPETELYEDHRNSNIIV